MFSCADVYNTIGIMAPSRNELGHHKPHLRREFRRHKYPRRSNTNEDSDQIVPGSLYFEPRSRVWGRAFVCGIFCCLYSPSVQVSELHTRLLPAVPPVLLQAVSSDCPRRGPCSCTHWAWESQVCLCKCCFILISPMPNLGL